MKIREATAADLDAVVRVQVESWHATYRGILPDDYLASITFEQQEARFKRLFAAQDAKGTSILVAEAAHGQIVGYASGGPIREGAPGYQGELYAIYLLPTAQRQGIGRQLVRAVLQQLARAGMTSVLVQVFAKNPAYHFYESLGGQEVYRKETAIGHGITAEIIAYGWADTSILLR